MNAEQLAAIRKRAENSIGRGPDWDDFEALLEDVKRLREALEAVEWEQWADDSDKFCPWCTINKNLGHAQNCPRQLALGIVP